MGSVKSFCTEPTKYYTYRMVAEMTGKSIRTVYNKIYGIRKEIASGRYSTLALPKGLINWYVYLDYLTYEDDLKDKYRRKGVPDFDPEAIAKMDGLPTAI